MSRGCVKLALPESGQASRIMKSLVGVNLRIALLADVAEHSEFQGFVSAMRT